MGLLLLITILSLKNIFAEDPTCLERYSECMAENCLEQYHDCHFDEESYVDTLDLDAEYPPPEETIDSPAVETTPENIIL